ncbi:MAG: tetratricopeptide repeat-containing protein [Bryobacteraceae bacterium]|nr:tetratricopeptide repeat-containing protein [Bryobacteraceae bacterium]
MRRRRMWWITTVLMGVVVIVASCWLIFGIVAYTRAGPSTLNPEENLETKAARIKLELDSIAEEGKRIDRMVTLLLGLTSLYALALGLNSYFGLKQVLDSAKEDSKRAVAYARDDSRRVVERLQAESKQTLDSAKENFQQFRQEIRDKYPELANLHANLRDLIGGMSAVFRAGEDWTEHAYSSLSPRKRQELLMTELRLAGLEVFRLDDFSSYRPEMVRLCQGFGRFYSSKFAAEGSAGDWERARLYFERAIRLEPPNAGLLKDFGVHLTQPEVKMTERRSNYQASGEELRVRDRLRTEAENAFSESLSQNADEPGSLFGLGYIWFRKGDYKAAEDCYKRLTALTRWREGERRKYLCDGFRNLACCLWLQGKTDVADVFSILEKSKREAVEQHFYDEWRLEVQEDGDLRSLFEVDLTRAQALFS